MRKDLRVITFLVIILYHMINGMVVFDGNTHLDYLYQKSLRYQHHRENYLTSLLEGLIPSGLRINKRPAFESVSDEFENKWNSVLYDAEKRLVKLLLKESENVVAKVQSEIELGILDSATAYEVTLERLEQKHANYKQNLEKRRDKKWKKFQQNAIKERRARKSHADTGYRKTTKVESIVSESKREQRVMVQGNENSADLSKRKDDRPIFAEIAPNKNITDNRKFRKKRSKTYAEALQSVETSNFGGEVLETLKEPNTSKEENDDFKRTVGIDLESIYARLKEDELLGSDKLSSPPRLCTDTSSSQNYSRYRNVSSDLDGEDYEILDILKEMLEGSKESDSVIPESKKNSEVTKDYTSGLTTVENRLGGYFCSETIFNLSHRVLTDAEIKVLGKGLDFVPIQRKINEPELRRDFNEFCRRMRLKWHFRDEPQGFNETPAFTPKSTWHPPKGHACLEVFLSQVEKEIFEIPFSDLSILICLEKSGRL